MIKIKANFDVKNESFDWTYKGKNTNTLENLCVIWNLIEGILRNNDEITEKDVMEMIKDRRKYMAEIGVEE